MHRITRAALVALLAITPALSAGTSASGEPAAAGAEPVVEPELATRLETAAAGETLTVMIWGRDLARADAIARDSGLAVIDRWRLVDTVVARGTASQVRAATKADGLRYMEADRELRSTQSTSHRATNEDAAVAAFKDSAGGLLDGSGQSIAIVDSGIDGTHPFFQSGGASRVAVNLKYACSVGLNCQALEPDADTNDSLWVPARDTDTPSNGGHGTHVAGIAGGGTAQLSDGRTIHGAAGGATLIGLSVGQVISVAGGNAGLNWVAEHYANPCAVNSPPLPTTCPAISVVNNSYGPTGGGAFRPSNANVRLQRLLVARGVTVVWAAGNDGGDGSADVTNPPGKDPTLGVLSVANYNDAGLGTRDGALNSSSSRGAASDPTTFPDISAPGTDITSSCRPQLPICSAMVPSDPDYGTISGTSMAAPHIAGIVALLKDAKPDLTPAQVELLLVNTAKQFTSGAPYQADARNPGSTTGTSYDKGHGLVDVAAAVAQLRNAPVPTVPEVCGVPDDQPVADPAGDATGLVVSTPRPNEPTLDLRDLRIIHDAAAGTLTFRLAVTDITLTPPPGSQGDQFDIDFSFRGRPFYVQASRIGPSSPLDSFTFGRGAARKFDSIAPIEGVYDTEADEIRLVLPLALLAQEVGAPAIALGERMNGFALQSWALEGLLLAGVDTAGQRCSYVIGAAAAEPPAVVPEIPLAALLPFSTLVLLGGAALVLRRRRRLG